MYKLQLMEENQLVSLSDGKQRREKSRRAAMSKINKYPHHCLRCGKDWNGRYKQPKRCTQCNSPYWNIVPTRSNATGTTAKTHTTANIPTELANGVKKLASEEPIPNNRSMTAEIVKIIKNAGVRPISNEEYEHWKQTRIKWRKFALE